MKTIGAVLEASAPAKEPVDIFAAKRFLRLPQPPAYSVTSVAAAVGATTTYSGAFTGGDANAFIGLSFIVQGCTNAVNNGQFICAASTATEVVLQNPSGVVETSSAIAYRLSPDDLTIQNEIIPGARRQMETYTGMTLASRDFVQTGNGFPFFPYFQSPYAPLFGAAFPFYFGYGPIASYPYPAIGGLQNQLISPFQISLMRSPVTNVSKITFIGTDGTEKTLTMGNDFTVSFGTMPCSIQPLPGQRWPAGVNGNSTMKIFFTAGYDPPTPSVDADDVVDVSITTPTPPNQFNDYKFENRIPGNLYIALQFLIVHYYQNRSTVVTTAGAGGKHEPLPLHIVDIIGSERVDPFGSASS